MFGRRSSVIDRTRDAAEALAGYVDPLAKDERLRRRVAAAVATGDAARRRVQKQVGLEGLVRRLGNDPVFRSQVHELGKQLRAVQKRQKKARSHKLRNGLLLTAGAGIVAVAVMKLRHNDDDWAPDGWDNAPVEDTGTTAV